MLGANGVNAMQNTRHFPSIGAPLPPGAMSMPNGSGGGVYGPNHCALCKTAPCDPVIGTDQKVYRNAHCAQCAGVQAVDNAVDRSICGTEAFKEIIEWVKQNPVAVVIAAIMALLLIRGR